MHMKGKMIHVAALAMLVFARTPAPAATFYVSPAGSNTPPFDTWEKAATNIQVAVDSAGGADTVEVAAATYVLTVQLVLTNGAVVASSAGASSTILQATGGIRACYIGHSNSVLDGFTIRNGRALTWPDVYGGGVCIATNGTVLNCIVTNNQAYYGGGICCSYGGTVLHCVVSSNLATSLGGGVYFEYGGDADKCVIEGNSTPSSGGGVYFQGGGTIRSCLVQSNESAFLGGGVTLGVGGTVEACTIVRNTARTCGGGLYGSTTGTVRDTILYFNISPNAPNWYHDDNSSLDPLFPRISYENCCAIPQPPGIGCTAADPDFVNAANGDCRLLASSPCINAGVNLAWMAGSQDVAGNERIIDGVADIGAHEYDTNGFACSFRADRRQGVSPLAVTLTACVTGSASAINFYGWDLDGDGTNDTTGSPAVTTEFSRIGFHSIGLTVSNTAGAGASCLRANVLKVGAPFAYAATNGGSVFPYTNWVVAATSLHSAVAACADGSTLFVNDGTFRLTNQLSIMDGILVQSSHGATACVMAMAATITGRCVYLSNPSSSVDGFTIRGGRTTSEGGGVCIRDGGTMRNCVIFSNSSQYGGGVYVYRTGLVENCTVISNVASFGGGIALTRGGRVCGSQVTTNRAFGEGGGVRMMLDGSIEDSVVDRNVITTSSGGGGGIYCISGTVARCVVSCNNAARYESWGGGMLLMGTASDCTIVSNASAYRGGGASCSRGTLVNCTILNNRSGNGGGVEMGSGDVVRNCLIAGNVATNNGGGGGVYSYEGGLIDNCTVVCNTNLGTGGAGGMFCYRWGTSVNSIIYFNVAADASSNHATAGGGTGWNFQYCCVNPTGTVGYATFASDPLFLDKGAGNFCLASNSPCVDNGNYSAWMSSAMDLEGKPRILNSVVDRGAYELIPATLDSNTNGIPDWWEWQYSHSLTGIVADADLDADRALNIDEWNADTSPADSNSCLRFFTLDSEASVILMTFGGGTQAWLMLEDKLDMTGEWSLVTAIPPPTLQTNSVGIGANNRTFFRLRAHR